MYKDEILQKINEYSTLCTSREWKQADNDYIESFDFNNQADICANELQDILRNDEETYNIILNYFKENDRDIYDDLCIKFYKNSDSFDNIDYNNLAELLISCNIKNFPIQSFVKVDLYPYFVEFYDTSFRKYTIQHCINLQYAINQLNMVYEKYGVQCEAKIYDKYKEVNHRTVNMYGGIRT